MRQIAQPTSMTRRQFCIAGGAVLAAGWLPSAVFADLAGDTFLHHGSVRRVADAILASLREVEIRKAQSYAARLAPWSIIGRMPSRGEQDQLVSCMQSDFYSRNHIYVDDICHSQIEIGVILNLHQATAK